MSGEIHVFRDFIACDEAASDGAEVSHACGPVEPSRMQKTQMTGGGRGERKLEPRKQKLRKSEEESEKRFLAALPSTALRASGMTGGGGGRYRGRRLTRMAT